MRYEFTKACDYNGECKYPGDPLIDPENWKYLSHWIKWGWIRAIKEKDNDILTLMRKGKKKK